MWERHRANNVTGAGNFHGNKTVNYCLDYGN